MKTSSPRPSPPSDGREGVKTEDALGHTAVMTVVTRDRGTTIALECACGAVFASGLFVVDDVRFRATIRQEGALERERHAAQVRASLALKGQS